MRTRRIGPFEVSAIGLGCMNLSHAYGTPPDRRQAAAVLNGALDGGITLFDTAALYGFGANEALLGDVLAMHRERLVLTSKCGMHGHQHATAWTRSLPIADLKSFWGALGCSCWAV